MDLQVIGWVGAISYIVAYLFLNLGILDPKKIMYQLLNVFGALCLIINAYGLGDAPTILVNVVWGVIALVMLLKLIVKKINLSQNQ